MGIALLALGSAGTAIGGTATGNLAVSASVSASCTIGTSPLAFGAYDAVTANAATALNGSGTVSVTCTDGSGYVITLGQGANADTGSTAAIPLRRMNDGGTNFLAYGLFSDAGRTTVWGDTELTGVASTGIGTNQSLTVYGKVTAGQNTPAGSYTDTIVATVTF